MSSYAYFTEHLPTCLKCSSKIKNKGECLCNGATIYRKGSYRIVRDNLTTDGRDTLIMYKVAAVTHHNSINKLWDVLREGVTAPTSWVNLKPEQLISRFKEHGPRNVLYTILECSEPLSDFFRRRLHVLDQFRLSHEAIWREKYGIIEDPRGEV